MFEKVESVPVWIPDASSGMTDDIILPLETDRVSRFFGPLFTTLFRMLQRRSHSTNLNLGLNTSR